MASARVADAMLPALAGEFDATPLDVAAVVTAFSLAYGLMQLVWGPLGDRLGKLRLITWAAAAATLGSLACALAPSLPWLVAARLATGACCAAIIPLSLAFIGDTVEYDRRQATLARFAAGTITGLLAGQLLGGFAADTVGWRVAFAVLAATFVATSAAALRMRSGLPAPAPSAAPPRLLAGWATVLRSGFARAVLATAALEGALVFATLAFVPTWLHDRTGLSLTAAGATVGAVGAGGLAYAFTASRWVARLGERGTTTVGAATLGAALVALALAVPPAGALAAPVAAAICLVAGFGFYMLHGTLQTLATQLAPQARGSAVGLFATSLFIGQAAGVAAAAALGERIGFEPVFVGCGVAIAALGLALGAAIARRGAAS